jgi:flavorubredoxin/flavin reductase (DIM6/NTAB) family NADH-FMN oxidoreductase RutF
MYWIGGNDRRLALFENVYPIPRGVSYNSYVVLDEKTVLLDTVDSSVAGIFFENLKAALDGRPLNYLIVNHMEPDHCAMIEDVVMRYPEVQIVCNAKTLKMIKQFFDFEVDSRVILVKEMDTLCTGRHTFAFVMAPMVHWPEAMVTYDATDKILYSADAFGSFGAINGNLYADEVDFERDWLDDARRYYTNIVGKYGNQVQALLKKAATIEINMICPLHGLIWRKNIGWFVDKYINWATCTPEDQGVVIVYASVYGNTAKVADLMATKLADKGICNIRVYDVSVTHSSEIVSEVFRCSHIIFASTTYNAGIFVNMENALHDIVAHNLQKRTIALVENGTWAPTAGSLMRKLLATLKDVKILDNTLTLNSALKPSQMEQVDALVDAIAADLIGSPDGNGADAAKIDQNAMFKLSYGLFVLTAKDGAKDNGCIVNTVVQLTDTPKRITVAVNKANYTHDLIMKTGVFNVSVLSQDAQFAQFKQFGFQSGRDVDKFAGYEYVDRSENGVLYVTENTNALISGKVIETRDYGTHTLFVADVTEAKVMSAAPSVTYDYYFANIKPKPSKLEEKKKGHVCKICGYVYEGDPLPADFICPLCKHGAEDFEPLS